MNSVVSTIVMMIMFICCFIRGRVFAPCYTVRRRSLVVGMFVAVVEIMVVERGRMEVGGRSNTM